MRHLEQIRLPALWMVLDEFPLCPGRARELQYGCGAGDPRKECREQLWIPRQAQSTVNVC